MTALRVTVWNEGVHEATQPDIAADLPGRHPRRDRRRARELARSRTPRSGRRRSPIPSTA